MVNCWVHKCESDGFKIHELAKRQGVFGLPSEVVVCELHRSELAGENPEWAMFNNTDGSRDLYVGRSLRELKQYLVTEPPDTATVYALGGTPPIQRRPLRHPYANPRQATRERTARNPHTGLYTRDAGGLRRTESSTSPTDTGHLQLRKGGAEGTVDLSVFPA